MLFRKASGSIRLAKPISEDACMIVTEVRERRLRIKLQQVTTVPNIAYGRIQTFVIKPSRHIRQGGQYRSISPAPMPSPIAIA